MKYANYYYRGGGYFNNLGDYLQILTIDYIYKKMGIDTSEIIYIDKKELAEYDGEPVILPIAMPLSDYKERGYAGKFSSKITPVFLGLTLAKSNLLPEEVSFFKKYEPIGCRDERTYSLLYKYGVNAYLGGCITVLLPLRTDSVLKHEKTFLIDAPKSLKPYLPDDIMQNIVIDTHYFYNALPDPMTKTIERYQQYAEEASLVVTSLLHCAIPCMAMGIPVIWARDLVSYRFGWAEALLHIYTPNEYHKINWNPTPIEYESHKQLIFNLVTKRLRGSNDKDIKDIIETVHNFYMNRKEKNIYVEDEFFPLKKFIDTHWIDTYTPYQYAVWGLTQVAERLVDYVSTKYPNASLVHVYDSAHVWKLNGVESQHPDNIRKYPDETVFVTSLSARESAKKLFSELDRPESLYALMYYVS